MSLHDLSEPHPGDFNEAPVYPIQVYSRGLTVSLSQLQVAEPWGSVQIDLFPTDVQSSLEKATEHLISLSNPACSRDFGAVAPLLIVRL